MTVLIRYQIAAAFAAVIALAAPAHPQNAAEASAPFVHSSGVVFPAVVDGFRRTRVDEFDTGGEEIFVAYESTQPKIKMSITILGNIGFRCRDTFKDADRDMVGRGLTRRDSLPIVLLPGASAEQFSATYAVAASPAAAGSPALPARVSDLWMGCTTNGLWTVTYRGVFDAADEAKAAGLAKRLFDRIDWTKLTKTN